MTWRLLCNSLFVGAFTTFLAVGLGFGTALWLGCLPSRWRSLFFGAAIVALAFPPFLVTNCWLHFLGRAGVWRQWLPMDIFSLGGTIWVLTLLLWPLPLLLVWSSWSRLEPAQLESDMQVRGWHLIKYLLFPLAQDALVFGSLLTLVLALNNFSVPAILQVKVLPAEMWIRFNTEFDTVGALRAGYPLLIAPLLLLAWFLKREIPWPHREPSVSSEVFRRQLGSSWFWLSGVCACAALTCAAVLPLIQIMAAPRTWTELPGAIAAGQGAIWNSFWYATVAATLVLVAGLMLATRFGMGIGTGKSREVGLEPKHHSSGLYRFLRAGLRLSWAGGWLVFLTPGVVLGIALIHAFNHAWSSLFYQSAWIVIVAFTFRYLILGWQTVAQSLRRVDPDLVDVAVLEGATSWQLMRHALWPQIARPAIVAWYIVFVFCLWDVETMILVVPPGGETLALRIFNLLHYGHNTQVNALCLTLLAVAIVPLIFGRTLYLGYLHWLQRARGRFKALPAGLITMALPLMLLTSCAPPSNRSSLPSKLFDRVQIIGTRGVGVGQLNKPRSLAVDGADNLYVVDMTGRVQKFSSNGVFLLSWQMPQTDRGKPKGMGRDRDGNILLVEPHYSRVNVFSPMGKLLAQWGSHGTNFGQLSMPRAVAVNSRGEIFVSEYQEIERVQKYAFEGGDTGRPDHRPAAGLRPPPRCLEEIGHAGTAPGEFNRPEGVCVDVQDRLYVADSCNHRIEVFDGDGRFLRAYGKPGQGPGELSYPYDICVDKEGRQYVCEFGNSRIQVFDPQGHSIEMIGGAGGQPGQFNNPWAVALDSSENLYVADSQNHRVQKLLRRK